MADGAATQSMDEILAQIRKIIAEEPSGLTRAALPDRAPNVPTPLMQKQRPLDHPAVTTPKSQALAPVVTRAVEPQATSAATTPTDDLSDLLDIDAEVRPPAVLSSTNSTAALAPEAAPVPAREIETPIQAPLDVLEGLVEAAPHDTARESAPNLDKPVSVEPIVAGPAMPATESVATLQEAAAPPARHNVADGERVMVRDLADGATAPRTAQSEPEKPTTPIATAAVATAAVVDATPTPVMPPLTAPVAATLGVDVLPTTAMLGGVTAPKAATALHSAPSQPVSSQPVSSQPAPMQPAAMAPAAKPAPSLPPAPLPSAASSTAGPVPLSTLFSNRIDPAGAASGILLPTHIGRAIDRTTPQHQTPMIPTPVDPAPLRELSGAEPPAASSALGALAAGLAATARAAPQATTSPVAAIASAPASAASEAFVPPPTESAAADKPAAVSTILPLALDAPVAVEALAKPAPASARPSVDAVMKALEPILEQWIKSEMPHAVNDALRQALPGLIAKAEAAASDNASVATASEATAHPA